MPDAGGQIPLTFDRYKKVVAQLDSPSNRSPRKAFSVCSDGVVPPIATSRGIEGLLPVVREFVAAFQEGPESGSPPRTLMLAQSLQDHG